MWFHDEGHKNTNVKFRPIDECDWLRLKQFNPLFSVQHTIGSKNVFVLGIAHIILQA